MKHIKLPSMRVRVGALDKLARTVAGSYGNDYGIKNDLGFGMRSMSVERLTDAAEALGVPAPQARSIIRTQAFKRRAHNVSSDSRYDASVERPNGNPYNVQVSAPNKAQALRRARSKVRKGDWVAPSSIKIIRSR